MRRRRLAQEAQDRDVALPQEVPCAAAPPLDGHDEDLVENPLDPSCYDPAVIASDEESLPDDEREDPFVIFDGQEEAPEYPAQRVRDLDGHTRRWLKYYMADLANPSSWEKLQNLLVEHRLAETPDDIIRLLEDLDPGSTVTVPAAPSPELAAELEAEDDYMQYCFNQSYQPSYLESLLALPNAWNEETLLTNCC